MKVVQPTQKDMSAAQDIVEAYRASGIAGRRYAADRVAVVAVAVLLRMSRMDIAPVSGAASKREYASQPGAVGLWADWSILDSPNRPDQVWERRLYAAHGALIHSGGKAMGWSWHNDKHDGFVLFRTA